MDSKRLFTGHSFHPRLKMPSPIASKTDVGGRNYGRASNIGPSRAPAVPEQNSFNGWGQLGFVILYFMCQEQKRPPNYLNDVSQYLGSCENDISPPLGYMSTVPGVCPL
jgi:hypothetical protein